MNISTRAAQQLHNLGPTDVAAILDHLRDHEPHHGVQIIDIHVSNPHLVPKKKKFHADTPHLWAFVGRHKSGELVLISVVEARPRAP